MIIKRREREKKKERTLKMACVIYKSKNVITYVDVDVFIAACSLRRKTKASGTLEVKK